MKQLLFLFFFSMALTVVSQADSLPPRNREVLAAVAAYGPSISPTYDHAVCTELVIGILEHVCTLTKKDRSRIRIIISRDVYELMDEGSPLPKGVVYALAVSGKGTVVERVEDVLEGDFVQFWYPQSWGHCGIVKRIDMAANTMELYSSFPSTNGFGVQEFIIPAYCYFVRLN